MDEVSDESQPAEQESAMEAAARAAREDRQRLLDYYARVEEAFLDGCDT